MGETNIYGRFYSNDLIIVSGTHISTQSAAQASLQTLAEAILTKDTARAKLGAMQNRLENTITNLSIQAENLQAAESRHLGRGRGDGNDRLYQEPDIGPGRRGHAGPGQQSSSTGLDPAQCLGIFGNNTSAGKSSPPVGNLLSLAMGGKQTTFTKININLSMLCEKAPWRAFCSC